MFERPLAGCAHRRAGGALVGGWVLSAHGAWRGCTAIRARRSESFASQHFSRQKELRKACLAAKGANISTATRGAPHGKGSWKEGLRNSDGMEGVDPHIPTVWIGSWEWFPGGSCALHSHGDGGCYGNESITAVLARAISAARRDGGVGCVAGGFIGPAGSALGVLCSMQLCSGVPEPHRKVWVLQCPPGGCAQPIAQGSFEAEVNKGCA